MPVRYLGEDLFFVDPSQKLAHFFGVQPEERTQILREVEVSTGLEFGVQGCSGFDLGA